MITKLGYTGCVQPSPKPNIKFGAKVPTRGIIDLVVPVITAEEKTFGHSAKQVCKALLGKNYKHYKDLPTSDIQIRCVKAIQAQYPIQIGRLNNEIKKLFSKKEPMSIEKIISWKNKQVKLFGSDKIDIAPESTNEVKTRILVWPVIKI